MRKLLFILIPILLTVPHITNAAGTQLFVSGPSAVSAGNAFTVHLKVATTDAINSIEGHISFPTELLQVTATRKGASILKLWPKEPETNNNAGVVSFAGGLPNPGYTGNSGQLIDITFKALKQGVATIAFTGGSQVLLNDGQGTATPWNNKSLSVTITKPSLVPPTPKPTKPQELADITPPTDLELLVGRDSYLFNGAWFAVFTAEDTESGIDHYEIAEINSPKQYPEASDWHIATSPYQLVRQTENTLVFLKAVDKAGNSSVMSRLHLVNIPQKDNTLIYIAFILFGIIIILLLVHLYLKLKERKHKR